MNFASQGNWEEKIFSILETKVDIYFLFQDGSKIDEEFFDKITEKISNLFEEMQEKAENLGDEDQSVGYLLNEEFENLLQTLISEEGYDNSHKALTHFKDMEYDWFIYYTLESVKHFSDYYVLAKKKEGSENLSNSVITNQIDILNDALKKTENVEKLKDFEPELTQSYIKDIQRFNSVEITKLVSKLYSKLS